MEFSIGIFTFHLYGFFIGLAIVTAYWIVERWVALWHLPTQVPAKLLWWLLVPALFGARLYHVIDYWEYYQAAPEKIPAVWEGGLGIIGGLIGGGVGLWAAARQQRISFWVLLDLVVIGIPFGQAIGRLGNWANQELYGKPTSLPWGIFIDPDKRIAPYLAETTFHPLFLYEALMSLVLGSYLVGVSRKLPQKSGVLAASYLIGYGLIRSLLEPMRIVSWTVGGIPVASIFSGGMILLGGGILFFRGRQRHENE